MNRTVICVHVRKVDFEDGMTMASFGRVGKWVLKGARRGKLS